MRLFIAVIATMGWSALLVSARDKADCGEVPDKFASFALSQISIEDRIARWRAEDALNAAYEERDRQEFRMILALGELEQSWRRLRDAESRLEKNEDVPPTKFEPDAIRVLLGAE